MTCDVEEDKRKAYVQRIVRLAILEVDARNPPRQVTQGTLLGSSGLGHGAAKRMLYHPAIGKRLAVNGCVMKTLTPDSFTDPALVRVRDVSDLVLGDLG